MKRMLLLILFTPLLAGSYFSSPPEGSAVADAVIPLPKEPPEPKEYGRPATEPAAPEAPVETPKQEAPKEPTPTSPKKPEGMTKQEAPKPTSPHQQAPEALKQPESLQESQLKFREGIDEPAKTDDKIDQNQQKFQEQIQPDQDNVPDQAQSN